MIAAALREAVLGANRSLAESALVFGTFGNVSAADSAAGLFAIKPSGVPYDQLTVAHIVPISIETGNPLETAWRPSSDTPTHLELYRAFQCGAVVHTHSESATTLAQASLPLRCMGTTHADYFRGDVPVTRALSEDEVGSDYERQTGLAIVEAFRTQRIDPREMTAVLVANHGPFVWGRDPSDAIERARVLELLARMEIAIRIISPDAPRPAPYLVDRHFLRKHGADAYYGQKKP